ncbi:SCO1664 family protein [Pseudonocardia ailaonensis]|uniref:SCO1664 family protein n=1 Tax=Pseudonocardia ailaonensis TaxID=367279 RepID=A0ABN2NCT7_9PSEU
MSDAPDPLPTPQEDRVDLRDPAVLTLLQRGKIDITGRMVDASNATLFGTVSGDGETLQCVYKPVRGERPLWDFPDGTLAGREVASYLVSEAAGWHVVPPTILRGTGPFGPGMLQAWVDTDTTDGLVDVCSPKAVPKGWRRVLRARDGEGSPAVLAHADDPRLRAMAAFDVVVNNADRKGGHVLAGDDGRVYGVDHGLTMHTEDKLRTVLWGWVGEQLAEAEIEALSRLRAELAGTLEDDLGPHVTLTEIRTLTERVDLLLAVPLFPEPSGYGPAIPWPAF